MIDRNEIDTGAARLAVLSVHPLPAADTERALAAQWADYFEQWEQSVGVEPLTPALMCRVLRGPKPFGIAKGEHR